MEENHPTGQEASNARRGRAASGGEPEGNQPVECKPDTMRVFTGPFPGQPLSSLPLLGFFPRARGRCDDSLVLLAWRTH